MKEEIVIAVIDSGVDKNDYSLRNVNIEDYYYDNQQFRCNFNGTINMHGTEVIKVILKEAPIVKIISIKTLQENNKCMLSDVVRAMRFAIDKGVNIINLSLGSCISKSKSAIELETLCEEATNRGIVIFAAENNPVGEKSFPANFDCVIGVTSTSPKDPYCKVEYRKKIVTFSESLVYVPNKARNTIRNGNSFLCPLLVGLFCRFAEGRFVDQNLAIDFMDFLQGLCREGSLKKIFFNRFSDERFLLNGKRVLFFADDTDFDNMRMYAMYQEVCDISLCFNEIIDMQLNQITRYMDNVDIFFIGVLDSEYIYRHSHNLEKLIKIIADSGTQIITVFPLVSTYERIRLTKNTDCEIKSIYK